MNEYIFIFFGTIFVNNLILEKFFFIKYIIDICKNIKNIIKIIFIYSICILLSSIMMWVLEYFIFFQEYIIYLQIIFYNFIVAIMIQFLILSFSKNTIVVYYKLLKNIFHFTFLHCIILLISILNIQKKNFLSFLFYSLGNIIGLSLIIIIFSVNYKRLLFISRSFSEYTINFITMGLIYLGFMSFSNLGKF